MLRWLAVTKNDRGRMAPVGQPAFQTDSTKSFECLREMRRVSLCAACSGQ